MILKTNPFPAELLLRLSGVNGYKPIHSLEGPGIAEMIKDYYNQISNLQREVITLTQEKGMLEQENKFLIAQMQEVYFQTTEMPISSSTRKDKNTERSYRSTIVTEFLPTKWRIC